MVLGHANPDVIAEVVMQLNKGSAYGVPTEKEIELAKLVVKKVPCCRYGPIC